MANGWLSISNNLVNMMVGKISVQSTLGKGTTFTVLLSFDKSEQSKQAIAVPEKFQDMKALVVDDDEDTCTYVKSLLERMGIASDTVNSGKKALRRVASRKDANHPYDVCIIDWNMKEMDGIETAKEVRKLCGDTVPIIIATAYDYADIMEEAKTAGYEQYRKVGYSKKFFEEHREEIQLHKAAKDAFNQLGTKKLPTRKQLDEEFYRLVTEKKKAYAEYRQVKKDKQEYLIAKQTVEHILGIDRKTLRCKKAKDYMERPPCPL